jgi:hypothetical protein
MGSKAGGHDKSRALQFPNISTEPKENCRAKAQSGVAEIFSRKLFVTCPD